MEKIIKKAIEGGYNVGPIEVDIACDQKYAHYFIDPFFWQALQKAMWNEYIQGIAPHHEWRTPDVFYRKIFGKDGYKYKEEKVKYEPWRKMMHRFIDHLAEGKDSESFFSSLTP